MEEDKKKNWDNPANKISPNRVSEDERRYIERKKADEDKEKEKRNQIQAVQQEQADEETHSVPA